jgi:nucleoside-diphosphate-sugar epimerase
VNLSYRRLHRVVNERLFGSYNGAGPAEVPGHGWVDVRDVAAAHVRALIDVKDCGGERIVIYDGDQSPFVWNDWVAAAERTGIHDPTGVESIRMQSRDFEKRR